MPGTVSISTSPAKAGAQLRRADWLTAALDHDNFRHWTAAFAGEEEEVK